MILSYFSVIREKAVARSSECVQNRKGTRVLQEILADVSEARHAFSPITSQAFIHRDSVHALMMHHFDFRLLLRQIDWQSSFIMCDSTRYTPGEDFKSEHSLCL